MPFRSDTSPTAFHVPTWLAPQMARLYDRHFGTEWRERSSRAQTWERIEDVDDGDSGDASFTESAVAGIRPRRAPPNRANGGMNSRRFHRTFREPSAPMR
jgi:hypothetical protein